jgi:hypothetical protein
LDAVCVDDNKMDTGEYPRGDISTQCSDAPRNVNIASESHSQDSDAYCSDTIFNTNSLASSPSESDKPPQNFKKFLTLFPVSRTHNLDAVGVDDRTMASPTLPVLSLSTTRSSLDSLVSLFLGDFTVPLVGFNWKPYIPHTVLSLKSEDEARLRYRALCHPTWIIADVIDDALTRGIPLQIAVPTGNAASSLPARHVLQPDYCMDQNEGMSLKWPGNPRTFADTWLDHCKKMFRGEHRRGFIFKGGLLWRLALEIGVQALTQEGAEGRSIPTAHFGQHEEPTDGLAFIDAPSAREIAIILGEVKLREAPQSSGENKRTLWPTEEAFFGFTVWQGEWNADCEYWFKKRWDQIFSPDGAMPMRQGEWRRFTRYGRRDRKDWKQSLQQATDVFVNTTGRHWNGCQIADIKLPETI